VLHFVMVVRGAEMPPREDARRPQISTADRFMHQRSNSDLATVRR
jgi:hypothetical protein